MAFQAIGFGIIFAVEVILMDVGVAIVALYANLPERPAIVFFMTGYAGCSQMRPFKFEAARVVTINSE